MLRLCSLIAALLFICILAVGIKPLYAQPLDSLPKAQLNSFKWNEELGLYQVVIDGQVVFVSRNYKYLIMGRVIEVPTSKDITSTMADTSWKMDFKSLTLSDAIKVSEGPRSIALFLDPECPYCQKELDILLRMKEIAVFVFLYPLEQIHPTARTEAQNIWCAADKIKALMDFKERKTKACDNPIDRNIEFARTHNIDRTPVIVLDNGKVVAGLIEADVLTKLLNEEMK
jgi:thiol:disulfide interchange protein DsbC